MRLIFEKIGLIFEKISLVFSTIHHTWLRVGVPARWAVAALVGGPVVAAEGATEVGVVVEPAVVPAVVPAVEP